LWIDCNIVVQIYKILKRALTFAFGIVSRFWHVFGRDERVVIDT